MITERNAINDLSYQVIGAAMEVHKIVGPGVLELPMNLALRHELSLRGITYTYNVAVPVIYKGKKLGCGYFLDILVEDTIVVEVKSVTAVAPVHKKQLLSYLHLTKKPLGLLINFNVPLFKDGITRIINDVAAGNKEIHA